MGLLKLKQTERREAPSTHLVVERGFLVRRDLLASEHHAMRSWNDGARGGGPGHAFLLKLKPYCKVGEVRRISDWEAPEKHGPVDQGQVKKFVSVKSCPRRQVRQLMWGRHHERELEARSQRCSLKVGGYATSKRSAFGRRSAGCNSRRQAQPDKKEDD